VPTAELLAVLTVNFRIVVVPKISEKTMNAGNTPPLARVALLVINIAGSTGLD
jgi:hypothetical protein